MDRSAYHFPWILSREKLVSKLKCSHVIRAGILQVSWSLSTAVSYCGEGWNGVTRSLVYTHIMKQKTSSSAGSLTWPTCSDSADNNDDLYPVCHQLNLKSNAIMGIALLHFPLKRTEARALRMGCYNRQFQNIWVRGQRQLLIPFMGLTQYIIKNYNWTPSYLNLLTHFLLWKLFIMLQACSTSMM